MIRGKVIFWSIRTRRLGREPAKFCQLFVLLGNSIWGFQPGLKMTGLLFFRSRKTRCRGAAGERPPGFVGWGRKEALPFLSSTIGAAGSGGRCGPVRACSRRMIGAVSGLIGGDPP